MELWLVRGLPGSGKTTWAQRQLEEMGIPPGARMVSADDFFMQDGEYKWVGELIPMAHQNCQNIVRRLMYHRKSPVIVHNTFTQMWEADPYFKLAEKAGYEVKVFHISPGLSTEELAQRNVHGVSQEQILRMAARWQSFPDEEIITSF